VPAAATKTRIRVGVDIVGVDRVTRLVTESGGIEDRVFTPRELAYCEARRRREPHLAARFAGKEAVLKALGTGLGRRMRWTDVEILAGALGRPQVHLHGAVAEYANRNGVVDVDVSLSHSAGLAVGQAIAVSTSAAPEERASALSPH
jgi:holo-[acyl-carrier protein] synthase